MKVPLVAYRLNIPECQISIPSSKYTKKTTQGDLLLNSIGSITEKLFAFVDAHLRPLVPTIPIYIKDTIDFLNSIKDITIEDTTLLVTIDIKVLYTCIPHNEAFLP